MHTSLPLLLKYNYKLTVLNRIITILTHPHDADVDRRHQKNRELEGPIVEDKYLDQTRRRRYRGPIFYGVAPEATW